jgi:hypothetical protein
VVVHQQDGFAVVVGAARLHGRVTGAHA